MPKGLVFLPSYYEAIQELPDDERLMMYDAIIQYGLYGVDIDLPPALRSMLKLCKPNIDASNRKYNASVENGKKAVGLQRKPKQNQSENQNETRHKSKIMI